MKRRAHWSLVLVTLLGLCWPGFARAAETVNDDYSTPRTTPLTLAAPGILGNDDCDNCVVVSVENQFFEGSITFGGDAPPDADGDPLPPLPSGASLTVHADGSLTYDGSVLSSGVTMDSFEYQAQDSRGLSSTGTVTINLTEPPPNTAPVAHEDEYSVELGGVLTVPAPGILGNDTDADGDPLSIATVEGVGASFGSTIPLSYGDLTLQADGSFTYTPGGEASAGVDEGFTYTISDGSETSNQAFVGISLTESTTGDTVVRVTFDDVGIVLLDAEVGRSGLYQLDIGAALGSLAQVGGAGLPPTTGALVLRNTDTASDADAREVLKGCERMALLAQAQPIKYDLVVEVHTATPGTSFSQGGDGEVIVDVPETRIKCWTARASQGGSP